MSQIFVIALTWKLYLWGHQFQKIYQSGGQSINNTLDFFTVYLLSWGFLNVNCVGFISFSCQGLILTLHSNCEFDRLSVIFIRAKFLLYLTFEEGLILIRILVTPFIVWVHEVEVLPEHIRKLVDPLIHLETSQLVDPLSPSKTCSLGPVSLSLCHYNCVFVIVSL